MYVDYSLVLKSTITFYMTNSLFSFRNQKKRGRKKGSKNRTMSKEKLRKELAKMKEQAKTKK